MKKPVVVMTVIDAVRGKRINDRCTGMDFMVSGNEFMREGVTERPEGRERPDEAQQHGPEAGTTGIGPRHENAVSGRA
jgi:hypothetical protein